jgi:glycine cleavage system transcriptional repressor
MQKTYMVVTIVGPDKRGLVAEITETIANNHGSIEESRMSRLGGEFAIIMLVSLDAANKDQCCTALDSLKEHNLEIFHRSTDLTRMQKFQGFVPYEISVWGADHEGIVHAVAEYLTGEHIQLEDVETEVTKAPVTGTPLFSMVAEVQAPPTLTLSQLRDKLDDLSDELGVDISVKLLMD